MFTNGVLKKHFNTYRVLHFQNLQKISRKEKINGTALLKLTDEDLKSLGMKIGERKNFQQFIHQKVQSSETINEPWCFSTSMISHYQWQDHGGSNAPYKSILVKDGDIIIVPELMKMMNEMMSNMNGFNSLNPTRVFALYNHHLLSAVQFWKKSLEEKFRSSGHIFKSEDWKGKPEFDERQIILEKLNSYISKFHWNKSSNVKVIPMIQGTSIETAWKIAQTGFTTVATLDSGWYGRGVYFTSSVDYAKFYSGLASKNNPTKCVILSMVVCGNVYPVREKKDINNDDEDVKKNSLEGKPIMSSGYQSHFVIVDPQSGHICDPTQQGSVDELVVFQDGQSLPMFIIQII